MGGGRVAITDTKKKRPESVKTGEGRTFRNEGNKAGGGKGGLKTLRRSGRQGGFNEGIDPYYHIFEVFKRKPETYRVSSIGN